jgi:hypothetical protein
MDRLWADDEPLFLKDPGRPFLEEGLGMVRAAVANGAAGGWLARRA